MRRGIFLLGWLLAASPAWAADAASVAVQTVALKQQMMTETISGYGVVSPDTRSLQNINLPRAGQVVSLLVNAGQVVKKGTPLLEFGTGPDAALSYRQASVAVRFAASEVTRIEQLVGQQLATQSQLAAAQKTWANAQAALQAQQKMGNGRSQERVAAPFDGVVVSISAAQGDRLAAGAPVLQLARAGGQRVVLGVEPEDVMRVRPGMAVSVASVFNEARRVMGRVAQVFGMINPQTQFVDVLVEVPNGGLIAGTRVRAKIQLGQQPAWVVPRSAVLRDAQGAYLFQVQAGKAHRVKVHTGLEQGGMVAVSGAFNPGQPVVSLGNYELQDGMAVRGSGR
ncbi:hemolysin D [Sulfuriferula plumbiphila]|uniref:Hemolysin D n=1 Tax=Sulfuriferula plumbiphila TaxID=171865 RepID=A0A512LAI3_9PROT|nr:efflux RND transporter periplasmic adaptor subunit [Sulfuriferula plumbiphila]BBP05988.1 hemolysin D [Sulfuriferula plumbiphila]GEP31141.1 hemolysin D [Sulfuriferula plumbiphila]